MKMSEAFPSKWIKADTMQNDSVVATIADCQMSQYADGTRAPALTFQGSDQMLGLNKVNGNMLATLFGDDTDNWRGKQIELFKTTTEFQGRIVPCIRVRAPQNIQQVAQQAQAPLPQSGDPGAQSEADYGAPQF